MKELEKNQLILQALADTKCKKLRTAILKNCEEKVIQTLSEIVHNILTGNLKVDQSQLDQLEKYKKQLKNIHSVIKKSKKISTRRKAFLNQKGGFLGPLIGVALSALTDYAIDKIKSRFTNK